METGIFLHDRETVPCLTEEHDVQAGNLHARQRRLSKEAGLCLLPV